MKGHWSRECPNNVAQPAAASSAEAAVHTREVHSTLPASDTYLEISVKGKTCNALIDTGSDKS